MKKSEDKSIPFSMEIASYYWYRDDLTSEQVHLIDIAINDEKEEVLAQTFASYYENSSSPLTVGEQGLYDSAQRILKKKDV